MITEAQKKASAKYDAEHTFRIYIKLNKSTDADIMERLEREPNKQGYIKELIRNDIANDGNLK